MDNMMLSLFIASSLLFCSCASPANPGGAAGSVTVDRESIEAPHTATTVTLNVSSDCDWGVSSGDSGWLTVSPGGGIAGDTALTVKISENDGVRPRESALTFHYGSQSKSVPVRQDYNDAVETPPGYELVWQDEFNEPGSSLPDPEKWWYETAEPGWVNNELQTYIEGRKGDITTALVSDGTLKIRAIKDGDRVYSARINTTEYWTYGYFEARLKLPSGLGTWPAFWMMPQVFTSWPKCGELDIMEHVGADLDEVSSSIHCQAYYHAINTQKTAARHLDGATEGFHVYALEWTEDCIRTYVDGELLLEYNPDDYPLGRNEDTWPFHVPFCLKLNLAWGGDWGGYKGIDESCLPQTFEIDYVRVFQKTE